MQSKVSSRVLTFFLIKFCFDRGSEILGFGLLVFCRGGEGGVPAAFVAGACIIFNGYFSVASSGSSSGQRLLLHIMRAPAHVLVALLGSAFGVLVLVCFLVFPLPPLPIQGIWSLSSIVFLLNSLSSVTGAWFRVWGGRRGSWLDCGRAGLWGVPPSWVWVVGLRPQILEHPNSISDTAVNNIYKLHKDEKFWSLTYLFTLLHGDDGTLLWV